MSVFRRRDLARLALGAGAAGLAAACAPAAPPQPTATTPPSAAAAPAPTTSTRLPTPTPVTVAIAPTRSGPIPIRAGSVFVDLVDSPLYLGFSRGYFARGGIDLQLQQYPTTAEMIDPLIAGQLEVVFDAAPSASLFTTLANPGGLKLVANQGTALASREAPYSALVVPKTLFDSGQVRRAADLKGRMVNVVALGSLAHLNVDQALRADGLAATDVQLVEIDMQPSLALLRSGGLAASFLAEPFITQARLEGDIEVLVNLEKLAPDRDFAEVIYSAAFAQRQPLANNFMLGYLQGVRDYLKIFFGQAATPDRPTVIDQLIGYLAVKDSRLFGQMALPWINPDCRISAADLQVQRDWFASQGLVPAANLAASIDNQFVDYAVGQLGPYSSA